MKFLRNIALIIFFSSFSAKAAEVSTMLDTLQSRFKVYSTWCSPEKVYLHYDRACYTAGETIWFRGWVQEASRISVLPPSNFLYAEVLDASGEAVVRVKIKRSDNAFPGCIELPDNLETGDYTIRAYTLWQLNNSEEYLFNDRLRIIGAGKEKGKKQKPLTDDVIISFWPEGGRYYAGHRAVVGFKVTDKKGRSVDFKGMLSNDKDNSESPVSTVHDGMGSFSFIPAPGYRYSIRDASGKRHPLPEPSEDGACISLRIRADKYYVGVLGMGGGEASLLLRDASELCPLANIRLDGKLNSVVLEKTFFRPGINHFLLVDSHGNILSERLFFIRDEEAPLCLFSPDRFDPARRALFSGTISLTTPDGSPLDGNCSVSVVRGALKNWQQSDGIVSYMGLSSELRGRINEPYYYFDPEIPEGERDAALDLLMMIQGWRYYDLKEITNMSGGKIILKYMRELFQEIRVTVSRLLSSQMPKKFTFTFLIPQRRIVESVDVEKGKHFIIDSLDFTENTKMLINIGTSRIGASYIPKWSGDPAASPFIYKQAPGFAGSMQAAAPELIDTEMGGLLQAAVVTASYEDNSLVFGRNVREDLSTYRDMTIVEYLSMTQSIFEYDGENMYNRNRRRSYAADDSEESSGFEDEDNESGRVKLIVGDTEDVWWSYDMLRMEDLSSMSISTRPDPVYGGDGGVVRITVKPGSVDRTASRNPSLLYFVPLGYQVPRFFEAPRYDSGDDLPYDARNTLLWAPDVSISGGRASIEFCNNDLQDYPYVVRIEGLSSDCRPFSRHCVVAPDR